MTYAEMPDHSPEPWAINDDGHVVDGNGDHLQAHTMASDPFARTDFPESDLRRIVACVNFCKGLETEYLTGEDHEFDNPVDYDLLMLHDMNGDPVFIYRKHITEFRACEKWTDVRTLGDRVWSVQETVPELLSTGCCPTMRQLNKMRQGS